MKKSKPIQIIILLTVVIGALIWWGSLVYQNHLVEMEHKMFLDVMSNDRLMLTRVLEKKFTLLRAVKAFVETEKDEKTLKQEWPQFAASLYSGSTGIRALVISPNGIVKYIYPVQGNEILLEHNFFKDQRPEIKADAIKSARLAKITVTGPVDLQIGGVGITIQQPIYKDTKFWGFASMKIDFPSLMEEAEFFKEANHYHAFRHENGQVFAGDSAIFAANPAMITIPLPEGYWEIGAIPKTGWVTPIMPKVWLMRLFSYLALILLNSYLYLILTQRHRLESLVAQRTLELHRTADQLQKITDGVNGIIAYVDKDIKYQYVNQTYETWYGLTKQDMLGKHMREVWKQEIYTLIEPSVQQVLSGKPAHYESTIDLKIGSRAISVDYIPHFGEQGEVVGFFILGVDITDRKQAEQEIQLGLGRLRRAMAGTIRALASATELRDPYTAGHQRRVANLARAIATEMELSSDQIEGIRIAATVHDIGKIYVPAEILTKPTKLTINEFDLIKTHSQSAFEILKEIEFPWPVADTVLQHHERLNGSGYPNKLPGEKIIIEAKIIAVADVVEAMANNRPYRAALGIEVALNEIKKNSGILYEPLSVNACIKVFEKGFIFD